MEEPELVPKYNAVLVLTLSDRVPRNRKVFKVSLGYKPRYSL